MNVVRRLRSSVYDAVIVPMTSTWYAAVLARLEPGSRLLDVGIGTGAALVAHAAAVRDQRLQVTGIDIDADYVARGREAVSAAGLEGRVRVKLESVYDCGGGPYDAAYFSGSFMLLPDPAAALRHVATLLAPKGRVFFTQTFEHETNRMLEVLKPLLRLATTIDFGRVTYEADFRRAVEEGGLAVLAKEVLHAGRRRSSVLVVAGRPGLCERFPREAERPSRR